MELEPIELITVIGILFVLSLIFTLLSYKRIEYFFMWLLIFTTFFVFAGIIPIWYMVLEIFIEVSIVAISIYKHRGENE